jgi:predicted ATPase
VLDGRAYEAESGRPYGPWVDALRRLPAAALGKGIAAELAPLLPELAGERQAQATRDRLFAAVVEVIAARAHSAPPVLIVLDDVHWCDEASGALLHYVARMTRHRAIVIALAAREGEMPDNPAMLGVLRSLRRDGLVEELPLAPLGRRETEVLVRAIAPEADSARVFDESAGNPLLALEVARSLPHRTDAVPQTLSQLVRDRIDRLPAAAADALRWAAVLGPTFSVRWLAEVLEADVENLTGTLETLERHALIRPSTHGGGRHWGSERASLGAYAFAHELVHRAVYAELSEPRRRLMHRRVAGTLQRLDDPDAAIAADITYHAALAGDNEAAARACVAAGQRCLRVFANAEAHAMARRGLHHAEAVPEPDRVQLMLELMQVSLAARRPDNIANVTHTLETLAERALDFGCLEHARLGFHLLSVLHWEGGDWSDAHRQSLRAELVSRSADEKQQIVAMAEAARCLALLERDLGQAESLAREASALAQRLGTMPVAIPAGLGMLRLHQGRLDEAAALFDQARAHARREGDHLEEFAALAHRIVLEFQRDDFSAAAALCADLVRLADKLREGSEAPFAHALAALAEFAQDDGATVDALEVALKALRVADAKHRLAFVLTKTAEIEVGRGAAATALIRAEEALRLSKLLGRPSDAALAQVAAARAAAALGNDRGYREHAGALARVGGNSISSQARAAIERLLGEPARTRRKVKVS